MVELMTARLAELVNGAGVFPPPIIERRPKANPAKSRRQNDDTLRTFSERKNYAPYRQHFSAVIER
jgi:hypothetical protein